jgi:hypothetical protein
MDKLSGRASPRLLAVPRIVSKLTRFETGRAFAVEIAGNTVSGCFF